MQHNSILTLIKNNPRMVYTILAIVMTLLALGSIVYRYYTLYTIDKRSETLPDMVNYSFSNVLSNDLLKNEYPLWKSLPDVLWYNKRIQKETQQAQQQREKLSLPYVNFLHFFYVPSLNIWKDPFSWDIDTTLVGEKYLQNNPYSDIELIQKRTNFFKDMGVADQYNTITDISLWSLQTVEGWFFALPITVQFETPDRRSFLLLVSKLSMTSYADNVALINEYMFYLWESIKKKKSDQMKVMLGSWALPSLIKNEDQLIGYELYQWVINDTATSLIDDEVVNDSISKAAGCVDQSPEECLYVFREKFRSVPYLAYGIARENIAPSQWLKQFFSTLPPLISLDSFSFDQKSQKWKKTRDEWYRGSISIKVYGKDLLANDVDEIAKKLWVLCFQNGQELSPWYGVTVVNRLIDQLGQQDAMNTKRSNQLNQILLYIQKIQSEYDTLNNYKKVIRLFESYRTLQEGNACDLIVNNTISNTSSFDVRSGDVVASPVAYPVQ